MTAHLESRCFNCDLQARPSRAPRDELVSTQHWLVGHAFNVTLPGWLVLVPTWHATTIAELPEEAAAELGVLLQRLSRALTKVTGCVKTYVMQFSEAEGYAHLHIHLVPRSADHPTDAYGPNVFALMTDEESRWLPEPERDRLSLEIRAALL